MVDPTSVDTRGYRNDIFTALAHRRRRTLLTILQRLPRGRLEELATHLVSEEADKPLGDVTRPEAERARVDLAHVHLPRLESADLVTREEGVVRTTEHPALQDPKIEAMFETDDPDWDDILASLADERRRVLLSTLYRNEEPMDRTDLAAEVAGTVQGERDATVTVEEMLRDLHHVHLPKLEDAGLVTYDVREEVVSYEGHPALDEEWLVAGPGDTPRAILSTVDQSADI